MRNDEHQSATLRGNSQPLFRPSALILLLLANSALAGVACGPPAAMLLPTMAPERDEEALREAAEDFYTASSPKEMRGAVARAKELCGRSALYHEIAAKLALLDGDPSAAFDHLIEALMDPASDAAEYHLEMLERRVSFTTEEYHRLAGVLEALRMQHQSPNVRSRAAWHEIDIAHSRGDEARRREALAVVDPLPLMIIGTWDNDQGKGLEMEYPPEHEIDAEARYPGYRVDAKWRPAPSSPRGHVDLGMLMYPTRWQVAYAATAVSVSAAAAGSHELRVTTSAPIKVWVNDRLVFENRRLGGNGLFDGVRIPIELPAGTSRVLVKSARERGSWRLLVRLTDTAGERLDDGSIRPVAFDDEPATSAAEKSPPELRDDELTSLPFGSIAEGSPRRALMESWWSDWLSLRAKRVELAEAFSLAYPDALLGHSHLARATWNNQERDRAADLLARISFPWEEAFPDALFLQARFWRQQNLDSQSRNLLYWLRDDSPHLPHVWWKLASFMENEGWHEERCAALEQKLAVRPGSLRALIRLARCKDSLGYRDEAREIYESVLAELPTYTEALRRLSQYARESGDHRRSRRYAERRVDAWPTSTGPLFSLGDALRAAGEHERAAEAWRRAVEMNPLRPTGYERLGRLAIELGSIEEATRHLQDALDRNPEAAKLAERLALLSTDEPGPWMEDLPGSDEIEAILAARGDVEADAGADVLVLLDDTVTHLAGDGIATTFVTRIARAENETGRDRLTRLRLRPGRHHRVLQAYAVDPEGRRIEATSIRGRDVRYRELAVGATVVLQYRVEARRQRFLQGHYSSSVFFNAPTQQCLRGRWVLWTSMNTILNEELHPSVERQEEMIGDRKRIAYTVNDLPPIIPEPAAPPFPEIVVSAAVSTVPSWDTFASWERSLLMDAVRTSSALEDFTRDLLDGAEGAEEKLQRILDFVIREIRYQQDYASAITGVKPHPAPVTFARRYGDCKDKAILMITMAREAGIDARFALVRTRDRGPLRRLIPAQQFNHAIVYVPEQPGVREARFHDPTVDDLDLAVLRHDNMGAKALVFDLAEGHFEWIEVPFQEPETNFVLVEVTTHLGEDAPPHGTMRVTGQGYLGGALRQQSRNPEELRRFVEGLLQEIVPGARLSKVEPPSDTALTRPMSVDTAFAGEGIVRRDDDLLRVPLPLRSVGIGPAFQLRERRYPLLIGAPNAFTTRSTIHVASGMEVERLPRDTVVETECLRFERSAGGESGGDGVVTVEQRFEYRCERIPPADYAVNREAIDRIQGYLADEILLRAQTDGR